MLLILAAAAGAPAAWPVSCSSNASARDVLGHVDLSGSVILTTGADGHIASQLNVALAQANASLILCCYSAEKCNQSKQAILDRSSLGPERVDTVPLDLSASGSIRDAAQHVLRKYGGGLDALVSAAGSYSTRMTHDGFVSAMEINLLGHVLLTELLLPALRKKRGRVVNVAAAVYGTTVAANTSVEDLTQIATHVDAHLNQTGGYFPLSKLLFIHHAVELSKREPSLTTFAVNPGYAVEVRQNRFQRE